MFKGKIIVETDSLGRLKKMPALPPNKRIETIFLVIGDLENKASLKRFPCCDLKGSVKIQGDIIDSVAEGSWDLPK